MGKSGVKGKNGENDVPTRKKGAPLKWGRAKKRGAKMYGRGADLVGILPPPFSKPWLRPWSRPKKITVTFEKVNVKSTTFSIVTMTFGRYDDFFPTVTTTFFRP